MTDAVIARLEKSAIVRVIHEEPAFSEMFIAHLLGRTSALRRISSTSCSIRARNVLPNAPAVGDFGKDSKPEPIIAKISQETLAEMIGTTRSRVSFFMNKFRKLASLNTTAASKRHRSPHSLLNVVLHEQPQIKT